MDKGVISFNSRVVDTRKNSSKKESKMAGMGFLIAKAARAKAAKRAIRAMHVAKAAKFARTAKTAAVKAKFAQRVARGHIAAAFRG